MQFFRLFACTWLMAQQEQKPTLRPHTAHDGAWCNLYELHATHLPPSNVERNHDAGILMHLYAISSPKSAKFRIQGPS